MSARYYQSPADKANTIGRVLGHVRTHARWERHALTASEIAGSLGLPVDMVTDVLAALRMLGADDEVKS